MTTSTSADAYHKILRSGEWFMTLPDTIQQQIIDAGCLRHVSKCEVIFAQGDTSSGLHGVIHGELHITGVSSFGNNVIMGIIRPSEWTGYLPCLDGGYHLYSATAVTKTTIFSLRPAVVAAIFETDVATYRLLQAPELTAARKLSHFVVEDLGLPLAQRVAARLADLGRGAYSNNSGPLATLNHISQDELAMSVHASRQKINVILRDLVDRQLIEIGYGRIRVRDASGLEKFAKIK